MKITVSFAKKLGLPGYSSVNASVELSTDLPDGSVLECPDAVVAEVRLPVGA